MNEKIAPKDNSANMGNANKGTPGTNRQYDQNQGNRGGQLSENQQSTLALSLKVARKGGARAVEHVSEAGGEIRDIGKNGVNYISRLNYATRWRPNRGLDFAASCCRRT